MPVPTTKLKNTLNLTNHDGSTNGLMLGDVLVTATAAELNNIADDSVRVIDVTASTLTVTQATHAWKMVTLTQAAGIAVTLPAAAGTGAEFKFFLNAAVTSNSTTIKVANSSDIMIGKAIVESDNATDACIAFNAGATDDTITLNGTTTGGLRGDHVTIRDVAANVWHVHLVTSATGTEVTPFSSTV